MQQKLCGMFIFTIEGKLKGHSKMLQPFKTFSFSGI